MRLVTNEGWGVSQSSGHGIDGVLLHVYKFHGRKCQNGQANNLEFATAEAADQYALDHGYLKLYGRNTVKFKTNRRYRLHLLAKKR